MVALQWLKFLIYLELSISQPADLTTKHASAMRSGSNLALCNRVCADTAVSDQEIETVINFYGSTPFRWFVNAQDTQQIQKLEQHALNYHEDYPVMSANLNLMQPISLPHDIVIKEVQTEEEINTFIAVGAASYEIAMEEYGKFIRYIINRSDIGLTHLYLGYYQDKPVAVSMLIFRGDITSVHFVGTLAEYRGKGMGYAITNVPLIAMRQKGAQTAILFSTKMGKSVYAKMGFAEFGLCKIYEPKSAEAHT